jgi:hypothetical protein
MEKSKTERVTLIQSDLIVWFCNYLRSKEQNPFDHSIQCSKSALLSKHLLQNKACICLCPLNQDAFRIRAVAVACFEDSYLTLNVEHSGTIQRYKTY